MPRLPSPPSVCHEGGRTMTAQTRYRTAEPEETDREAFVNQVGRRLPDQLLARLERPLVADSRPRLES